MPAEVTWISKARAILDHIELTQSDALNQVADKSAAVIAEGRLVHLFGSGHSRIPLEEMFPRYGSYPGFHPIAELSLTFHTQIVGVNGQRQALHLEGVSGLAAVILDNFQLDARDLMIVFSAGGHTVVPLEMAIEARSRGMAVAAVTSLADSNRPGSPGPRLIDNADIVVDIGTPPGDALVSLDGLDTPLGPGSTLAYTAVVNEIKVRTAQRLLEREAMTPVITSAEVVGASRSEQLFEAAYDEHGRRLARLLAKDDR